MDFPSGGRGMISRSDSASWVVDVIKKATGNTHMCGGELCISTTPELVTEQAFEFIASIFEFGKAPATVRRQPRNFGIH